MNLVEDPRAAGEVRRYHTWAVHRNQSVAEHTWQVVRILLTVWPNCPRNMIVYGLVHDMGEMAGDIQYPFKHLFPELGTGSERAELYVRDMQSKGIGAPRETHPLSLFEKQVFKCCDNLEMWEYGIREVNLGNSYGQIVVDRMKKAVAANIENLEAMRGTQQFDQNWDLIPAIHRYMKNRLAMEPTKWA